MNSEERKKVLQMVEEKKISVEEAEKLFTEMAETEQLPVVKTSSSKKFLRIEVMDGEDQVKVNLPISLVKLGLSFVPKEAKTQLENQNIDLNEIVKAIEEGADGKLVDIQEKNGAKVSIYLE